MSDSWAIYNPVRLIVGDGCRKQVNALITGKKCLIVCSARGRAQFEQDEYLCRLLKNNEVDWFDAVVANPDITSIANFRARLLQSPADVFIGFGGGSAIDTAKVLAVCTELSDEEWDDGKGASSAAHVLQGKRRRNLLIALPTTAGTGSEVTPFATMWDYESKTKISISGDLVYPDYAFVDSGLLRSLPAETVLYSGLDAINQALESIWNVNANSVTRSFASEALKVGLEGFTDLIEVGPSAENLSKMAHCSCLSGFAISQTKTAICHSISYPLTAHYGVPHGLACAFTQLAILNLVQHHQPELIDELEKHLSGRRIAATLKDIDRQLHLAGRVRNYVSSDEAIFSLIPEMFNPARAKNFVLAQEMLDIKSILLESLR